MENLNEMKENYKKIDDIAHKLRNSALNVLLDFDCNGKYEFIKCEICDGPILGHLEVKCQGLAGT